MNYGIDKCCFLCDLNSFVMDGIGHIDRKEMVAGESRQPFHTKYGDARHCFRQETNFGFLSVYACLFGKQEKYGYREEQERHLHFKEKNQWHPRLLLQENP